ncbi:glycosyltransferase family 2 protein [Limoniibacter endophyticus]|uniref:Glycosyl transferase n=1 Tax=Limoniibacter endophyticus TaxID=1565040 RepID=A0A8J3DFY6_9HYPH|nr:glycosyltransferase family 2 protein [Limoniibacter endophyticus]GHC67595.1 glycosyl transferase [Limoniibacter endophyticus]
MVSLPDNITLLAQSPGLKPTMTEVIVILPTFRRPGHLRKTLDSLILQQTQRIFAVIVMENDAEKREGAEAVTKLFTADTLSGMLIIAHDRGNCSAYNAGFITALQRFPTFSYLLIIDDDEIADPHWIERMCSAAEEQTSDIVGGPQVPMFAVSGFQRLESHPVFHPPYRKSGRVKALYSSGNLLIARDVLEAMGPPHLDLRFNFLGGGDSDFLSRSAEQGYRLGWCAEAPVFETVPARRTKPDWIRSRAIRNGVISTLVERKKRAGDPLGRIKTIAKSLALLVASPLRGLVDLVKTGSLSVGLYPVYVAFGRLAAEFGYINEQYRQAEKN